MEATSAYALLPGALVPLFLSEIPCDVVKESGLTFSSYTHGRQDPSEIFHLLSFHRRLISHSPALNLLHLAPGEPRGSPQQQWCETVELENLSGVGSDEGLLVRKPPGWAGR